MLNDLKVYEERIYSLETQMEEKDKKISDLREKIKLMENNDNKNFKFKNDYEQSYKDCYIINFKLLGLKYKFDTI